MAKKKTTKSSAPKPKPKTYTRNSFSRDIVFDDAEERNAPIIAEIKQRNSPYLNHLLTLHNPNFYIVKSRERLNNGEFEDAYIFTYHSNGLIFTFFENVNPGKATLIFSTTVGKNSDGRDYNGTLMSIRQYMGSAKINKRQALIYSCRDMIGSFFYDYHRISHCDISNWPMLIRNAIFIEKGNNNVGIKTIKVERNTFRRSDSYNPFSFVGDFNSFFAGRTVFLSSLIPTKLHNDLFFCLQRVRAKVTREVKDNFSIAIVFKEDDYTKAADSNSYELFSLREKILSSTEQIRIVCANRTRLPR